MITCEICGTQAEQHDHWRHLMVARVAALEKFVTREPAATAEQPSTTKGCADCLLCGICQTHAPGEHDERCHQGVTADPMDIESIVGDMAAEQPSLQETGGGNDPHDILCDCPPCYAEAEIRETERKRRDRAKAKADEQPDRQRADILAALAAVEPRAKAFEHKPSRAVLDMVLDSKPAEPSGTGQLPSAPVEREGHLLDGLRPKPRTAVRRFADDMKTRIERASVAFKGPEQEAVSTGIRYVIGVIDAALSDYDVRDPGDISEPPAPAAGTLSDDEPKLLSDRIYGLCNALPKVWLERGCDLAEEVRDLEAKLAQAERERDERGRQVEQMADHVAKMRVERDEATGRERERCLAWSRAWTNGYGYWQIQDGIEKGKPAPECDPDPPRDSLWDRPFMVEVCPHGCSEPSGCDICTPELAPHESNCRAIRTGRSDTCDCALSRNDPPREVAPDRTQAGSGGRTHWRGCAMETGNGQCDCGVIR